MIEKITINPVKITYKGEDGKEHVEEITEAFKDILINKEKETNQGGKIMSEGMNAVREEPLVMKIENLLEEVEKETYSLRSEIHGINEKLLPATIVRDISESEKKDKEIPRGWFVKIVRKLEIIRDNLREIDTEEIRKLKRATGLLGPKGTELKGDEGGC